MQTRAARASLFDGRNRLSNCAFASSVLATVIIVAMMAAAIFDVARYVSAVWNGELVGVNRNLCVSMMILLKYIVLEPVLIVCDILEKRRRKEEKMWKA